MHTFKELVAGFGERFGVRHFPETPASLYEPGEYFLSWGGVHMKYGVNTALLTGDVMMIRAYEYLNLVNPQYLSRILELFNRTAREVCEGQQLDIDFERMPDVSLDAYIHMISLKTSVLLAATLEMGAILGGASEGNCRHIYEFGKNLGIAFQVQDDYLDAFGDPEKFGKEVGGDIRQNKKTFLLIHALEVANAEQKRSLETLMQQNPADKVEKVLDIFRQCGVDAWAVQREDGSWLLEGLVPVSELKARLDIRDLPEEDRGRYNTLAGLLLAESGHLPAVGERIACAGWIFEVLDLDGKRIDKVLASKEETPE